MSIAVLGYKLHNDIDNSKILTLDTGELSYIDNITMGLKNAQELKSAYQDKIKPYSVNHNNALGDIVLSYIRDNEHKVELPLIFDDEDMIHTRTSSLEEVKSETERARKLLLNSRNQLFLDMFLANKNLSETTNATVKMTIGEYKIAKKEGYNVTVYDGEYRISILDVLKYRFTHKKLGPMRLLVEDTLEVWKKNVLSSNNDDLYFYSRELRLLLNEYDYRKIPRKVMENLSFNREHFNSSINLQRENNFIRRVIGVKQKVLDSNKAA